MNRTAEFRMEYLRLKIIMETAARQAYYDGQVQVNGIYMSMDFMGNLVWRTQDKRRVNVREMEEHHATASLNYAERKREEITNRYDSSDFSRIENRLGFWLYWYRLFEIRVSEIDKARVEDLFNEAEGNEKYNDFLNNLNI